MEKSMKEISRAVLHEETMVWLKELDFEKDEYNFLQNLLSTPFLELSSKDSYEAAKKKIQMLQEIDVLRSRLKKDLKRHDLEIAELMESFEEDKFWKIQKEHDILNKEMESFILNFKYLKRKVFRVIKDILRTHKQKLLIEQT